MSNLPTVHHRFASVSGVDVFYRTSGRDDAPAVLLLHGFPSSSHQYRRLIPFLADRFRVIAPDLPGFGLSAMPGRHAFAYTFANYADVMTGLLDALGVGSCSLYMMDYGVPVGLRMALKNPSRFTALAAQNGAPYAEAFGAFWDPLRAYWADNSLEKREPLRQFLRPESTRFLYEAGVADRSRIDPAAWIIDQCFLDRPGNADIQLDLFYDNRTNGAMFEEMQRYLREARPPMLVLWGKNDPVLDVAGAQAYRRDLPDADIRLVDSGHCALEDRFDEMAPLIHAFYSRAVDPAQKGN